MKVTMRKAAPEDTPQLEPLPKLEGLGVFDGHQITVFYKDLEKIYVLYQKASLEKGNTPYVGGKSGKGDINSKKDVKGILDKRDQNHHINRQGFGRAMPLFVSNNPNAIRGMEQPKIEEFGGPKSKGGTSSNKINGIRVC